MSNRAYLLAVDDPRTTSPARPETEILAEGIDEIPVFWASLFTPSDRRTDRFEGSDGELEVANYCVSRETAGSRLRALRVPFSQLLDDRSGGLWSQWCDFILDQKAGYLRTEASEVWDLDPDGYDEYWETLLDAFAHPSTESFLAAAERNEIDVAGDKIRWDGKVTVCKLAGADHIRELPWM